jgi:hypothetical protein
MENLINKIERSARNQKLSIVSNHQRGGGEIKPGTLHGGEEIKPGTLHGGEEIKPGTLHGGEEIKPGTLHGGEEIKPGTLHGGEEIKPGTLHGGEGIKPGTLHGGEEIKPGILHGGEEIKPGTLHGGEEIKPGTLHGGEEIKPGTLHGGEEIKPGTLHGGEEIKPGTLHGGEEIKPGTLHGGEEIKSGTLHGGEEIKPSTLHGGEEIKPGTLHCRQEIKPSMLRRGEEIKSGTLQSCVKLKSKSLNNIKITKGENNPFGYNLEKFLAAGEFCCEGCAMSNYDNGFSQGRKDRVAKRQFNTTPSEQLKLNPFFRGTIFERGYTDGYVSVIENEQLKEGTLHASYTTATYRTKDGSAIYKFSYIDMGGKFEVDIILQPSYQNRDSSESVAHWLPSARGGKKICVTLGCEPTSLQAAKNLSTQWAELTHKYIKTGQTIDDQVIYNNLSWWEKIIS